MPRVTLLHFASLSKDEAKADGNLSCTLGVSLEGCRVGKSGRNGVADASVVLTLSNVNKVNLKSQYHATERCVIQTYCQPNKQTTLHMSLVFDHSSSTFGRGLSQFAHLIAIHASTNESSESFLFAFYILYGELREYFFYRSRSPLKP